MNLPIPPRPDDITVEGVPTSADARPISTWGWWEGIGFYILAFLAGGIAATPVAIALGNTSVNGAIGLSEIVQTIAADLVITGVLVAWLARRHKEWRAAIALPPTDRLGWHLAFGVIAGAVLVPAIGLVSGALETLFRHAVGHQVSAPQQVAPGLSTGARVLLVLLACFIAPISEEFFFRGILFRTVRDRHGFWVAALCSAVPFGAVHYVPAPAIDALVLQVTMVFTGIGLAWIYERRGTIVASMAAHAMFNVLGVIVILGIVR